MNNAVRKKLDVVNFLRGFSIFTIVLMHLVQSYDLPGILMKATSLGGAGVHVFILCSGFGLYLSYLYKPLNYDAFLKYRFSKVYLPYILVIFISALYYGFINGDDVLLPLLSHVFLFKMFVPTLENSFGGQMWFISTIIQFYIVWPFIVKLVKHSNGLLISLLISLTWALFTTIIGVNDVRIWNSFFLQYLWEFVLGMYLANLYYHRPEMLKIPKMYILIICMIVGLGLSGVAGIMGGIWKSFNDIPSMIGYISVALILYKIGIKTFYQFFTYTNKVSFEWYLTHILLFSIYFSVFRGKFPFYIDWIILMPLTYIVAIAYSKFLKLCKLKK